MKNRLNKEIKQKNIFLILIVISIIAIISLGTYALLVWNSKENTEVTLRIGSMAEVKFESGQNVNISNLGPVFDYEKDGETANFTVNKITYENINVNVKFNVTTLSDSLKHESFKYALLKSYNNVDFTKVAEGDFSAITDGSVIDLVTERQDMSKVNYRFIIYIDGNMNNPVTMQEGNLVGYISVEANVENSNLTPSLQTLTTLNLTRLLNDGEPDFSQTATTDEGIYAMEDDLGTSYYFRGASDYNYVKFANYYWRIIRINGDGTVRMIYDGTTAHTNGEMAYDRYTGTVAFNPTEWDNTYVGYMYGIAGVTATGEEGYSQTHSNLYDSDIKTYLEDTWYATNIKNTTYEQYIADAIYCNDRSLDTSNSSYTGIGTTETYYSPYQRLQRLTTPEPTLKCNNQNDRFTYNESVNGVLGNDKLEAPVGLITADEVALAGACKTNGNNKYYLYNGEYLYWTMSSYNFSNSIASEFIVNYDGSLGYDYVVSEMITTVRPVISISVNAIKYGDGGSSNPFRLTSEI